MANPQPTTYSAGAGKILAAGQQIYPHASLDLIAAAPENSWIKLNTNTFQSAWSPADSRWMTGGNAAEGPDAITRCWASFGWDSNHSRLVIWGGGHANSWANEVYTWSAHTRQWAHAFYCTDMVTALGKPVDGNNSPVSSHTYANNVYLPILDRFFIGGGAAQPGGGPFRVWDGDTPAGFAGGFTLDLALAGQGFVGGLTGSNCTHGTWTGKVIPGAKAWKLRDFWDGRSAQAPTSLQPSRIEHGAIVTEENGHDVMYGVIASRMYRVEFVDDNQENDIISMVAGYDPYQYTNGAAAFDPVRRIIAMPTGSTTNRRLNFVDLKVAPDLGASWPYVASYPDEVALGYMDVHHKYCGFAHYPAGDCFVYWRNGRQPFLIHPPAGNPTPTTGWTISKPAMDAGTDAPPEIEQDTYYVSGKFRYAPDLGCCIAVRHEYNGDVWALKLAGWTDPRT